MTDGLDGEWVTQYVFKGKPPQDCPRSRDTDGMSALLGFLDPDRAGRYVRFQAHHAYEGDSVRQASVERLRAAGFTVTLTPTRRIPIHVSISYEAEWTPEVSQAFNECFTEVMIREGR